MDLLAGPRRSALMRKIKSRNTHPEIVVRRLLHQMGFRFRLHRKDLPGKPDIVLPKWRAVIFIHGCFWHGCNKCDKGLRKPKTNASFWAEKITANMERDARAEDRLAKLGWKVLTVWECELKALATLETRLRHEIAGTGSFDAIG